jgi:hypothetical protein
MPVESGSHTSPTRFASGGRLTTRVGLSGPSTYQRHRLFPRPCGLCLSLLPVLGTSLAITRLIVLYSATSLPQEGENGKETAIPPRA